MGTAYSIAEPWITPSWGVPLARSKGESARPDLWPDYAVEPILGPSGSYLYDVAGRKSPGLITGASWNTGCLDFWGNGSGTEKYVDCGISPSAAATGITVQCLYIASAYASNEMLAEDGTAYNFNTFYLYINAGKPEFEIYTQSGTISFSKAPSAIPLNTVSNIIGAWGQNTAYKAVVYVNGIASTVGTQITDTLKEVPNTNLFLGLRPAATKTLFATGKIVCFRMWLKSLSESQILRLTADPYCWLRPRLTYYTAAEAAAFKWYLFGDRRGALIPHGDRTGGKY